jgi:hypothetical protein
VGGTPGPPTEVRCVREMFHMLLHRLMGCSDIARELNRKGKLHGGNAWNATTVNNVLKNPIYEGANVWARTSQKMHTSTTSVPKELWVSLPRAFEPIIASSVFERAQQELSRRGEARKWTDEKIVNATKALFRKAGTLSAQLIDTSPGMPSSRTIRAHFGSYRRLYALVGYPVSEKIRDRVARVQSTLKLRQALTKHIVETSVGHVAAVQRRCSRRVLVVNGVINVSIMICPTVHSVPASPHWKLIPNKHEHRYICLLCLLDETNTNIRRMLLFPHLDIQKTAIFLTEESPWLATGVRLYRLKQFYPTVLAVAKSTL